MTGLLHRLAARAAGTARLARSEATLPYRAEALGAAFRRERLPDAPAWDDDEGGPARAASNEPPIMTERAAETGRSPEPLLGASRRGRAPPPRRRSDDAAAVPHPPIDAGLELPGETSPAETNGGATVTPPRAVQDGALAVATAPLEAAPHPVAPHSAAQLAAAPDAARPPREPADPPLLITSSAARRETARDPAAPRPGDREGKLFPPAAVPQGGAAPEVHVRIGRIEVTAVREAAATRPRAPARQPPRSLDAYLATRDRT